MAASMRLLAARFGPRLPQNLKSPQGLPSCANRSAHQSHFQQKSLPLQCVTSSSISPIGRSRHASTSSIADGRHRAPVLHRKPEMPASGELLSICSRLTCLTLQPPLVQNRPFSSLVCSRFSEGANKYVRTSRLNEASSTCSSVMSHQPHRTVIRYSKGQGKKKTTKAVIDRFCRLDNGLWVRTQAGRAKKLWKKSARRRNRLKQHVFCNKTQSKMLDRMVCGFWKTRRYHLDDPFEIYHERNFDGNKMWTGPKEFTGERPSPKQ